MASPQCGSCKTPLFHSSLLVQMTQTVELRKRLRSNDSPSHFEASHCQAIISSSSAELERYDAELFRLKAVLHQIKLDRAAVEDYSRLCRYILSPIRRLPTEILVDIFRLCLFEAEQPHHAPAVDQEDAAVEYETRRVAKAELLRLSQVCPRWHRLIMGTPILWSSVQLDLSWWVGARESRMMDLLRSVLERGMDSPLEIRARCNCNESCDHSGPLGLLAQHSRRWEIAVLSMNATYFQGVSAVEGNLPRLEALQLNVRNRSLSASRATKLFEVAPRLTELWFTGPAAAISNLPLEQLRVFGYIEVPPQDLVIFLPMATRLPTQAQLIIRVDFSEDRFEPVPLMVNSPLATSELSSLELSATGSFTLARANDVFAQVMGCLSLPSLDTLRFKIYQYEGAVIFPWPHHAFSSLSHRSSLHSHLICLELYHVLITETELVQTLSTLHSLLQLIIWDHKMIDDEGADFILITDSLLHRLTWSPSPTCLAPRLSYLGCQTLLQFDDTVLRDFALSRVKPGRNENGPFEIELEWYPGHHRELDAGVRAQFEELQSQGEFLFSSHPSDYFAGDGT
ncbi:hypothetical protein FB451DRAFT_1257130 [Mycena latifolia]|nr:hypothetical protein FB451DRAFT_1257130 [Mycena latifolia]